METKDIIYTAGLFDGEGSISLSVNHGQKTKNGLPRRSPMLLVQLSMTNKGVIEWLIKTWSAYKIITSRRNDKPGRENHSTIYKFRMHGVRAEHFLRCIRPYLKVKSPQADLVIRLRERGSSIGKHLSEEERLYRLGIRDELIALNGRSQNVKHTKASVERELRSNGLIEDGRLIKKT